MGVGGLKLPASLIELHRNFVELRWRISKFFGGFLKLLVIFIEVVEITTDI